MPPGEAGDMPDLAGMSMSKASHNMVHKCSFMIGMAAGYIKYCVVVMQQH